MELDHFCGLGVVLGDSSDQHPAQLSSTVKSQIEQALTLLEEEIGQLNDVIIRIDDRQATVMCQRTVYLLTMW
jgi:hypothetical protein